MTSSEPKRHSFRPLLFAPPQGSDAMAKTLPEVPLRPKAESHVRIRAARPVFDVPAIEYVDAQDLLDELLEDQVTLSMNLVALERAAESGPRDPSARAALRALTEKVADMFAVRDAIAAVQNIAIDHGVHPVFCSDAAAAEYLRGLYAWMHAVVRALDTLVFSMKKLEPDWALFRWRLEEAKNFHFDELHDEIRDDVAALERTDLAVAIARVFAAAEALEASLDQKFG
jgi:hypothetical protein